MKITEIAKKAHVSVATVSRVINDDPKVKASTKKLVSDVIREYGYVPNNLGRNLRTLSTNTVLVVLPTIDNPFYSPIVHAIEDESAKRGYNVMLCNSYNSYEKLIEFSGYINKKTADAMIVLSPENGRDYSFLTRVPAVVCGETQDSIAVPQVDIDHEKAGYEATKHLLDCGRRRIAFIGGSEHSASGVKRERGYLRALADAGIEPDPKIIMKAFYDYSGGMEAAKLLLKSSDFDAVFAISDELAIGFGAVASAAGKRIPEDIAVMGFDDIEESSVFRPRISTVAQPRYDMGKWAAEQLFAILEGKQTKRLKIIDYKLIVRESTAGEKYAEQ